MQKKVKHYKTNPGVGRRRRWKILFAHKDLRGFILFFHDHVNHCYWVYDGDTVLLQAVIARQVLYNPNGQAYIRIVESAFPAIQQTLDTCFVKYALQDDRDITAYDFVPNSNPSGIAIGSRFLMDDGAVAEKYVLTNGDYQQSTVINLANGANQVMNVPLQEINGYINISSSTPIGALVLGKNVGDCFNNNGIEYTIKEIF